MNKPSIITIKDVYGQIYKVDAKTIRGVRKFNNIDDHNPQRFPVIEITMPFGNRQYIKFFNDNKRDYYFNKLIKAFHS